MALVNPDAGLPNHLEPTLATSASLALLGGVPHVCSGCRNVIDQNGGGTVVIFGEVCFHQECFQCAKCGDHVPPDVKALLFVDGAPICEKCSYTCSVCKRLILDEVIMTGEDTYHADCFCCKQCSRRIDELVFAKTTQGVYCMDCHNERVARSRRHAEQKRAKSKNNRKDKDRPREHSKEAGALTPQQTPRTADFSYPSTPNTPSSPSTISASPSPTPTQRTPTVPSHAKRLSTQVAQNSIAGLRSLPLPQQRPPPQLNFNTQTIPSNSIPHPSVPSPTREQSSHGYPKENKELTNGKTSSSHHQEQRHQRERVDTLPLPSSTESSEDSKRRKSYDDGVRPLQLLFNPSSSKSKDSQPSAAPPQSQASLDIPNRLPLAERRKSISPAPLTSTSIDRNIVATSSGSDGRLSPSPLRTVFNEMEPPDSARTSYYSPVPSPIDYSLLDKPSSQPNSRATSPADVGLPSSLPNKPVTPPIAKFPSVAAKAQEYQFPSRSDSLRKDIPAESPTPRKSSGEGKKQSHEGSNGRTDSPTPTPTKQFPEDVSILTSQKEKKPSLELERTQSPQQLEQDFPRSSSPSTSEDDRQEEQEEEQRRSVSPPHLSLPALPPMRFSMNESDFADLLNSVSSSPRRDVAKLPEVSPPAPESESPSQSQSHSNPQSQRQGQPTPPPQSPRPSQSQHSSQSQPQSRLSQSQTQAQPMPKLQTSPVLSPEDETFSSSSSSGRVQSPSTTFVLPAPPLVNGRPTIATSIIIHDTGDSSLESESPTSPNGGQTGLTTDASESSRLTSADSRPLLGGSYSSIANSSNTSLASRAGSSRQDTLDLIARRLRSALEDTPNGNPIKLDREFVDALARTVDGTREKYSDLKGEVDKVKRTSQQYMAGMSVAQEEYHKEIAGRREAEAEVTRLRVQLSGQAVQLSAMAAEDRRREVVERIMRDLSTGLHGLEMEIAKLKVEKDMALNELEELHKKASTSNESSSNVIRSFTLRLENIKTHYKKELEPLKLSQEKLLHEIAELKEARDIFLEETTALNARNEELAELNAQIARQIEGAILEASPLPEENGQAKHHHKGSFNMFGNAKTKQPPSAYSPSITSTATSATEDTRSEDSRYVKVAKSDLQDHQPKKFKWFGTNKLLPTVPPKVTREHNFIQQNVLRIARCDHCGDKMWGTLWRCTHCNAACHPRCLGQVQLSCVQLSASAAKEKDESVLEIIPLPPTMFGRDLIEQVRADAKGTDRAIPIIVEKCIGAVESLAMDYEGIYRKTGGSSQSKAITQLFERGNYDAFDLEDTDVFNDISSVTSVLKTYFRQLPDPLFTYTLHESFVTAAGLRDQREKSNALSQLVLKLPREHYYTLRHLMSHLHRVMQRSDENLMNARNLGVVFGPTLMRSSDPSREFADMAGKALSVEWLVENAPNVFPEKLSS